MDGSLLTHNKSRGPVAAAELGPCSAELQPSARAAVRTDAPNAEAQGQARKSTATQPAPSTARDQAWRALAALKQDACERRLGGHQAIVRA